MTAIPKEHRKNIYEKVTKQILDDGFFGYLCGEFSAHSSASYAQKPYLLPEFGLFKPTAEEAYEYDANICWFAKKQPTRPTITVEENQIERLICLDLCLLLLEEDYMEGVNIADIIGDFDDE